MLLQIEIQYIILNIKFKYIVILQYIVYAIYCIYATYELVINNGFFNGNVH